MYFSVAMLQYLPWLSTLISWEGSGGCKRQVLAFQAPERAAVAQRLVQQHNAHIRQLYEAALEPLCAAEVQQAHECTVSVEQQPWQQQQLQQAGA